MSVKIMGLVWDCDLPRNEKYVLLALADHADHDGNNVYPSVGRVAWKTGYDERMVQRIIKGLISKGILVRDGSGKRGTNRYRIEVKYLPERPDYGEGQNAGGGKMSPQDVQNVTPGGGKIPPESSSNHPLESSLVASNKNGSELDEFIEPKPLTDAPPVNGKTIAQRIADKDPALMMAALGVTAKDRTTPGLQAIHDAGWKIGDDRIKQTTGAFLDVTPLPVPAKPERGKWLAGIKAHLEEFTPDELPRLYRLAWEEYCPQVLAGEIDITHPAALTTKMRAIKQRGVAQPTAKPKLLYRDIRTGKEFQR